MGAPAEVSSVTLMPLPSLRLVRSRATSAMPSPIAGGMVYALIALALRDRVVNLEADDGLRNLLQVAFFTTIGLSVRMETLRRGGVALAWLLAAASLGVVLQNALGMALAHS